jgi:hypothetical protein
VEEIPSGGTEGEERARTGGLWSCGGRGGRARKKRERARRRRVETCSRRWRGWPEQRCTAVQRSRAAPEEEEKGDFPRDLFVKLKNYRDPTVN